MSLRDRYEKDNHRVFMNPKHFAKKLSWGGREIICITDDDNALKRKNNNVVDISWDNNTTETTVYVPADVLARKPEPNTMVFFDNREMKVLQVQKDGGMFAIVLVSNDPKML